jgi:hypothetical protein
MPKSCRLSLALQLHSFETDNDWATEKRPQAAGKRQR